MQLKITQKEAGQRLDIWLAAKFYTSSRHFLQKEIKAGRVLVLGKPKKPSYKIKEGDLIKIELKEPKVFTLQPNPKIKLSVIFEDKNIIAINKPAGISVHPGTPPRNNTIVNGLLAKYPEIKEVGDEPQIRPGIVHRLDKDTSGIMLVARNQISFEDLKKQFKARKIEKKYLALAVGNPKRLSGIIESFMARSRNNPTKQTIVSKKFSFKNNLKKRLAKTKYRVKKNYNGYSLIECSPKTGRMHQIRVQLKSVGLPIVGDSKYGPKRDKLSKKLGRQFLHAQKICFKTLEGKKQCLSAPLAQDLSDILEELN